MTFELSTFPSMKAASVWHLRWDELASASGNMFLSPAWLQAVHESPSDAVVLAHEGERLLGVLPLTKRKSGSIAVGLGDACGDYGGALLAQDVSGVGGTSADVLSALLTKAFTDLGVARIRLRHLRTDGVVSQTVKSMLAAKRWVCEHKATSSTYVLKLLPEGFDETLASLRSSKSRYNLRRAWKQLEQLGEGEGQGDVGGLRVEKATNVEEITAALAWLGERHRERWPDGLYSTETGRDTIRGQCLAFHALGRLGLYRLLLGTRTLACALGFENGSAFCYYNVMYDESLSAQSPGSLLLRELIRTYCEKGFREFDLLMGDEPYKAEWGGSRVTLDTYTVYNPESLSGRLLGLWGRMRGRAAILP